MSFASQESRHGTTLSPCEPHYAGIAENGGFIPVISPDVQSADGAECGGC